MISSITLSPLFIRFTALLILLGAVPLHATPTTLLVLGDSLSAAYGIPTEAGWVALLQQRLHRTHPDMGVVNASISGETTLGGLTRLPALLAAHHPHILLLELGANDGLRGLPLTEMRDHLTQIITLAQQQGATVLLIGIQIPANYGRRYTQAFSQIYTDLAQQWQLPLLPFLLEGVADRPEWMQSDQLHPTAAAQPHILDRVWEVLQPLIFPKTP